MSDIAEVQAAVHANAIAKKFWAAYPETPYEDPDTGESVRVYVLSVDQVLSKLMLITTEVAEAAEDVRTGAMRTVMSDSGKPEGLPSELADIVIRVIDVCGGLGIDLDEEIRIKVAYNRRRPAMHNKLA